MHAMPVLTAHTAFDVPIQWCDSEGKVVSSMQPAVHMCGFPGGLEYRVAPTGVTLPKVRLQIPPQSNSTGGTGV